MAFCVRKADSRNSVVHTDFLQRSSYLGQPDIKKGKIEGVSASADYLLTFFFRSMTEIPFSFHLVILASCLVLFLPELSLEGSNL